MPRTNPAPLTAAEKTAAARARRRAMQARVETMGLDEKVYVLTDVDVALIKSMLKTRIDLAGNADAKAEYRDLEVRLSRQMSA